MSLKGLIEAIEADDVETVAAILKQAPELTSATDEDGKFPLHHAAESGNCDAMALLLSNGASMEAVDSNGRTFISLRPLGIDKNN
ncbi:hypothetical protein Poli38472_004829 [Pythium oligandrum]|uniref:Ankyrin repeat protein n=1 Tax=Pythium oligandrum TaxID=41045 RepID=A0A8K1FDT5_PYTOL|nr:hypothetical protein Poli38472_004829 [Pythium oligandrum]|eukprot:TMW59760.1 hypothetical protein Poli38472_004829 [Pythium oligandrum]